MAADLVVVALSRRADAEAVRALLLERGSSASLDVIVPPDPIRGGTLLAADPAAQRAVAAWWATLDQGGHTRTTCLVDSGVVVPTQVEMACLVSAGDPAVDASRVGEYLGVPAPTPVRPRSVQAAVGSAGVMPATRRTGRDQRVRRRWPRADGSELEALGQALLTRPQDVPVIAVCNPKGGPGKTTTAIGLALTLDAALATTNRNGRVFLVDANTRMSDTFRSMPVQPGATTVRALVDHVCAGVGSAPRLQYANEDARHLVVLPEAEDGAGYRLREIESLVAWLRERSTAVVVDLVNDLPGTTSVTERLVQWWLLQADVAVVPAKANLNDLEGAERMVRACGDCPAVVAYLRPADRRLGSHPRVEERLARLRESAAALVDIPEDVRVRMAALDNLHLTAAGSSIRRAFEALTRTSLEVAWARRVPS